MYERWESVLEREYFKDMIINSVEFDWVLDFNLLTQQQHEPFTESSQGNEIKTIAENKNNWCMKCYWILNLITQIKIVGMYVC
jgi:hypothetical protein